MMHSFAVKKEEGSCEIASNLSSSTQWKAQAIPIHLRLQKITPFKVPFDLCLDSSNSARSPIISGIAVRLQLLLKIIEEHPVANARTDERGQQRVAGMISILDDVKEKMQKKVAGNRRMAELRRCNTDVRSNGGVSDEKEKLKKQLHACQSTQKSLMMMCSSLGKEKEIIAAELTRKVHECNEMEELVNDLKAQNETLMAKLHKQGGGGDSVNERNKTLSEQLLKSLESYRLLKRKYNDVKEQNRAMKGSIEEIKEKISQIKPNKPIDVERHVMTLHQWLRNVSVNVKA